LFLTTTKDSPLPTSIPIFAASMTSPRVPRFDGILRVDSEAGDAAARDREDNGNQFPVFRVKVTGGIPCGHQTVESIEQERGSFEPLLVLRPFRNDLFYTAAGLLLSHGFSVDPGIGNYL
jgi:hypothetical protein